MTVTTVAEEEKKERQQRRLLIVLFALCVAGFSYLIYDYFDIVNRTTLPEDLASVNMTVDGWKSKGLVTSFNPTEDRIVVSEEKWSSLTKAEKIGIVTQLARYCADEKRKEAWKIQVLGNRTSAVMGELGTRGLIIQ